MKRLHLFLVALALAGCEQRLPPPDGTRANNTALNRRDRDPTAKTPIDQNENRQDVQITADIRKRVMDAKLSTNGRNCKIITQDGKVTLRGPVASREEKQEIGKIAAEVAGEKNVDDQLEIAP